VASESSPPQAVRARAATASTRTAGDPAPMCAQGMPSAEAEDGPKVMRSGGAGWVYVQQVPDAHDGANPVPLVIALGTDEPSEAAVVDDAVVLAVAEPRGAVPWTGDDTDERFVRDLILQAETDLCFDEQAVYVTGLGSATEAAASVVESIGEPSVQLVGPADPR
ncbi:MAG: hypothetical protein AAGK32_09245, partial [Actinomycetota bacterium]